MWLMPSEVKKTIFGVFGIYWAVVFFSRSSCAFHLFFLILRCKVRRGSAKEAEILDALFAPHAFL